ncbi:MAG: DUF4340 domain-containing protein [Planctomycetota bacterium]|nr:MAG: DUF4340 domain-containing protein [Planctomycetota bacterium]
MNEFARSALYVLVAAGLAAGAVWTRQVPEELVQSAARDERGTPFFPEFSDIAQATSLEVWEFDEDQGGLIPFKVEFKDGVWRIPSHFGYPADAKDRLARTASAFIGLQRTVLRTDREEDFPRFGVVDPQADESAPSEGRGRRVTLRDADGKVLVDMIIGRKAGDEFELDGKKEKLEGQPGLVFVRRADEKRVYGVKLDLDLSTKFKDWIETDLLQLDVAAITSITNDAYKVDEEWLARGAIRILPGEKTVVGRKDGEWIVEGMGPDERANIAVIDSMTDTLRELTIVDVLPRERARLEDAGFFLTNQGVYSNEGELRVDLDTGVTYVLRFGEVVPSPEGEEGLRRFMVVQASFNPKALKKPDDEEAQKKAKQRVEELNKRFGDWYYVISAASFDSLRPPRKLLTEPKPAEDDAGEDAEHEGHDPGEHDHGEALGPPRPGEGADPGEGATPKKEDANPSEGATPKKDANPGEGAAPKEEDANPGEGATPKKDANSGEGATPKEDASPGEGAPAGGEAPSGGAGGS